jgi:hypothetical protein
MANLKSLPNVFLTAVKWAVVWGLFGAAIGAVATIIEPDTGHIPRNRVPLLIGLPSAVFGAIAGLIYGVLMMPARVSDVLGAKGRVTLGAVIGAAAGIVLMNLFAHSFWAVILAALLGGVLAASAARSDALRAKN